MAKSPEQEHRQRRRRRLLRGLLLGAAAIGLPAAANALVARKARSLPTPGWGRSDCLSDGETLYHRLGERPSIALLHSFGPGHSGLEWRPVAERLARSVSVAVPDLPGWGDSRGGLRRGREYVAWLHRFLEEVVQKPAVVVAAGLSAAFAVRYAVEHPGRVRALALVTPRGVEIVGEAPGIRDALIHRLLRVPVLGTSAVNIITSRSAIERYLRREVYYDSAHVTPEVVESHYRAAHLPGAYRALTAYLSGLLDEDVTPLLDRLRHPVWIAWGRESASPAVEAADLWLRRIENADLEVFAAARSRPHLDVPDLMAAALGRFLSSLPA